MCVLGVLDVQGGVVVRDIGGRRREYHPIVSGLTSSTRPVDVGEAFRRHFGLAHLYLADLDAIAGSPPCSPRSATRLPRFPPVGRCGGPRCQECRSACGSRFGRDHRRLETVSRAGRWKTFFADSVRAAWCSLLDLKAGMPLGDTTTWQGGDAETIASQAVRLRVAGCSCWTSHRSARATGSARRHCVVRLGRPIPMWKSRPAAAFGMRPTYVGWRGLACGRSWSPRPCTTAGSGAKTWLSRRNPVTPGGKLAVPRSAPHLDHLITGSCPKPSQTPVAAPRLLAAPRGG